MRPTVPVCSGAGLSGDAWGPGHPATRSGARHLSKGLYGPSAAVVPGKPHFGGPVALSLSMLGAGSPSGSGTGLRFGVPGLHCLMERRAFPSPALPPGWMLLPSNTNQVFVPN